MKTLKCMECGNEKIVDEDVAMMVCGSCQKEMEEMLGIRGIVEIAKQIKGVKKMAEEGREAANFWYEPDQFSCGCPSCNDTMRDMINKWHEEEASMGLL